MKKDAFDYVALSELRLGLFVDLDLGWMAHPFASSRFKITSERQIETLRGLGVTRIRYVPSLSDALQTGEPSTPGESGQTGGSAPASGVSVAFASTPTTQSAPPVVGGRVAQEAKHGLQAERQQRLDARAVQHQSLAVCERRFSETAQQYHKALGLLPAKPLEAAKLGQELARGLVSEMLQQGETAIRLLTEAAGDKAALHPVNVTVISLLLGRAMGLQGQELDELGIAALLHDMGQLDLPERVRRWDDNFSATDIKMYQEHVHQGVRMAKEMGLAPGVVQTIAQHHELADGSGFPLHLKLDAIGKSARILSLTNRYDNLCNPTKASAAMTPHEALSSIFAQQKTRFDGAALSSFIRMMGVYPPGSVVQLNDERHALVVSVNSGRPLKPRLLVHEPGVPRHEALVLDLERAPNTSIRRSLKPSSLPTPALDYLQPRLRMCYFFEPAANAGSMATTA